MRDASTDLEIDIDDEMQSKSLSCIHRCIHRCILPYIHTQMTYHVKLTHVASGQLSTALRATLKDVLLRPQILQSLVLLDHTHWQGCSAVGASQVEEAVVAGVEYAVDRIADISTALDLRLATTTTTATIQSISLFGLLS